MGSDCMLSGFAVNRTTNHTNAGGFSERTRPVFSLVHFPRVYGCTQSLWQTGLRGGRFGLIADISVAVSDSDPQRAQSDHPRPYPIPPPPGLRKLEKLSEKFPEKFE
jgi:hypothetical protein